MNPLKDPESRAKFLSNFKWDQSVLSEMERSEVEKILVEFNDIFSGHRLHIGGNADFTVKLTPEHGKKMYTQGPPTPTNLREDLIVEFALMQYYGVNNFAVFQILESVVCSKKTFRCAAPSHRS